MTFMQKSHPAIEAFQRDGFVRLSKLIPETLIDRAHAAVPDVLAGVERVFGRCRDCGSTHQDYEDRDCGNLTRPFVQLFNVWAQSPALRDLVFCAEISRAARALLGCSEVRLVHDQLLVKRPGDSPTSAHIDGHYWPFDGRACSFWIPLVDVSRPMGTLLFYRGTHRQDVSRVELQSADEEEARLSLARWITEEGVEPQGFELTRGDVTVHDKWTIHCTEANESATTRVVLVVHVMDARSKRVEAVGPMQKGHVDLFHWQDIPASSELYTFVCPVL